MSIQQVYKILLTKVNDSSPFSRFVDGPSFVFFFKKNLSDGDTKLSVTRNDTSHLYIKWGETVIARNMFEGDCFSTIGILSWCYVFKHFFFFFCLHN